MQITRLTQATEQTTGNGIDCRYRHRYQHCFRRCTQRVVLALVVGFCAFALAACESAEQKRKDRLLTMEKFCTGVVKHLLDHNPDTIRDSITRLQREELPQSLFEKMQRQGVLPETELGILKIIDESEQNHTSNEVEVKAVKPLVPVEKAVVPFSVAGVEICKRQGKPDERKPFACTVTCKLSDEMEWPQALDISGLAANARIARQTAEREKLKKLRRR